MDMPKQQVISLILAAVALGATGQLLIKQGVGSGHPISGFGMELFGVLVRPLVVLGLAAYGVSSLFWLKVLSGAPLSYAYPFIAISYVLVVFLGWAILKETVALQSVAGLSLICIGVVVHGLAQ